MINIGFIGTISTGKTTLLNALFTEQLGDTHIKKTTLLPHIYHESDAMNCDDRGRIQKNTNEKTTCFLKAIDEEKFEKLEELNYNVQKLNDFVTFQRDMRLVLYDIPGLNDSATKNIYYSYINSIFIKFNIVIWMIDINSSINTSDEIDICNMLITGIKNNHTEYGIDTKLIVLLNKCDEQYFDENGCLILDEDKQDMFDQAKKNIDARVQSIYPEFKYQMITISSENSYIYRTIKKGGIDRLDMKYMNKLGYLEYSRSEWIHRSESEKKTMLYKKLDSDTINNRLINTGFNRLRRIVQDHLDGHGEMGFILDGQRMKMFTELNRCNHTDYRLESFKQIHADIEQIIRDYDMPDNLSDDVMTMFNQCMHKVIRMFEAKNKSFIETPAIRDNELSRAVDIKRFYEDIYSFVDIKKQTSGKYSSVMRLIANHHIAKINRTVDFTNKLYHVKQLQNYECETWFELLIACFVGSTLTNAHSEEVLEVVRKCRLDFELFDSQVIDLMLTILDSRYSDYFKTSARSNIIRALKLWTDYQIRSDNIYAIHIFMMIRFLDRYVRDEFSKNQTIETYDSALEKYLIDVFQATFPNSMMHRDDFFRL